MACSFTTERTVRYASVDADRPRLPSCRRYSCGSSEARAAARCLEIARPSDTDRARIVALRCARVKRAATPMPRPSGAGKRIPEGRRAALDGRRSIGGAAASPSASRSSKLNRSSRLSSRVAAGGAGLTR